MKRTAVFAALLILALLLSGCVPAQENAYGPPSVSPSDFPSESPGIYRTITAEEAVLIMEEPGEYALLDVRTSEEFEESRIEGAINIPDYELADRAAEELPDTEAVILIYCRSGRRSAQSAKLLADMGYENVYDFGGIIDWPFQTVSGRDSG